MFEFLPSEFHPSPSFYNIIDINDMQLKFG